MSNDTDLSLTAAAKRLSDALESGIPGAPVRDLIGMHDLDAAYAVQRLVGLARERAGARVIGRKIGLTSVAVQSQLGVDQPDFGVLYDDMQHRSGSVVPAASVLQPRVEAEIAFVLRSDLDGDDFSLERIAAAVDSVVPALEICGSRIDGWDITLSDTVADNASAGAFVLGSAPMPLTAVSLRDVRMTMRIDGEIAASGTGTDCLGDPLVAVQWLARTSQAFGEPLRAGQIVLSGALGAMRPVGAGAVVVADFAEFGDVSVSFS